MSDKEKIVRGVFHFCKEHAGGILTLVASVGLIVTAVEVGVATTKAQAVVEEKKKERETWKESSGIDQPPITKEDIVKIGNLLTMNTIYFLKNHEATKEVQPCK